MQYKLVIQLLLYPILCHAAPAQSDSQFNRRDDLPLLKLPYANYKAASHNPNGDVLPLHSLHRVTADRSQIYTFKNIRYAAPPTGNLRFAKPAPPAQQSGVQDGSYGPICKQAPVNGGIPLSLPTLKPTDEGPYGP